MRSKNAVRILLVTVSLVTCSLPGAAQNESLWQKLKKSAKQTGQNAAQQGSQQAQQVQQQVQQQIPVVGGQGNQMAAQSPCGNLNSTPGGTSYNGGQGGAPGSCGASCFDAGPFSAAVTQMTMSQQGYYHIIRMNMQFHNATNQPLIIAYREGSMVMVDELGNTYQAAGGSPGAVQGMGIDRGNQTDSQFVLGAGQTGNALFSVARARGNTSAIGSAFAYNFTIDELQGQNGADAIPVRQYNLNFPSLSAAAISSGSPVQGASPSNAAAGNIVGGGRGKASAIGLANYVGGNNTPVGVPQTSTPNAVSNVGSATPAANTAVTPAATRGGVINPTAVQRGAAVQQAPVRGQVTVPAKPSAAVQNQPPARPVVNTALRAPATQTRPATPAKPIPTKPTNPTSNANQTTSSK